jgi:capsular exopolysaccharide synthesis family protein
VPVQTLFTSDRVAADLLATQFGVLQSATLAERVVNELNLRDVPEFTQPTFLTWVMSPVTRLFATPGTQPPDITQKVVERFRSQLIVNPQEGSRLVQVAFDDADPVLAARIVNSSLDNYIRLRMEEGAQGADWLAAQLADSKKKLDEAQRNLQAYVRQHGLQVFETGKGETENLVNDRLKQLHEQLAEAQAERYQKQSAYEQLTRQGTRGNLSDMDSPVIQSLTVRLADLKREGARLASTFHEDYPRLKDVTSQIADLEKSLDTEVKLAVSRSQRDYRAASRREDLLREALGTQQASAQALQSKSAGYESLKREVVTNQQLYTTLDQKMKEVGISSALKATNVGVVDRAKPPLTPYRPPIVLNLGLGIVIGLLLAVGGVLALEYFDGSVRTIEDIESSLSVPALATIPVVAGRRGRRRLRALNAVPLVETGRNGWQRGAGLEVDNRGRMILAEAFAALRTAVLIGGDAPSLRTLLVTSSQPGEGKTTICVNLALSLAKLGRRVLLVDADLRHPSVHSALGLHNARGLSDYLAGHHSWRSLVRSYGAGNLDVIVGGRSDASPSEWFASNQMRHLIVELAGEYDFVIIDSPPLLVYPADVRTLAALVDGALLAVRSGATPREAVIQTLSHLPRAIGVVLNGFDMRDAPAYYRGAYDTAATVH